MSQGPLAHRLLLIRHGETVYNAQGRFRGRADPPLTDGGRSQARSVAEALASLTGADLVSSPRRRARATLEAIALRLHRPGRVDDRLDDLDYGAWTGLEPSEAAAKWPTESRLWRESPEEAHLPEGESVADARDRVWRACRDLADAAPTVLAVTHDVCVRMAVCALLNAPLASMHHLRIELCSITEVSFTGGRADLVRLNDTSHVRGTGHRAGGTS